ncbi:hypothetical protein QSJ19_02045 [Gordonia sp. ABSL11-1]|uniref:hypothetical protein n=1 Tax=Gordonia sp. ABSL11-1 TaxID=3053924 RepID=UPI0025747939|nr:hypothetical protein [Gordonia sp. ABSL11-1]MDL9944383.1 hypothetical protein [Gordonia sp. ABSL11-1]
MAYPDGGGGARRILTVVGSIVAVAAVLAGCGQSGPASTSSSSPSVASAPNVYEQQRAAGVQNALDALGDAVVAGDPARVGSLLDPAAGAAFRVRLETSAGNFSAGTASDGRTRGTHLSLKSFRYQPAPTEEAETLVPPDLQTRLDAQGSSDSWVAPIELRYALGGAGSEASGPDSSGAGSEASGPDSSGAGSEASGPDSSGAGSEASGPDSSGAGSEASGPGSSGGSEERAVVGVDEPEVVVPGQFVMARYGDDWKVVGDAVAIGGTPAPTQMWELPGLAADDVRTAGGTSVVASYPGTTGVVDRVRRQLPGAVTAVTGFWGADWPRRAVVVATERPADFRALAQSSASDITGAAAATVFSQIDSDQKVATGQRVILTPKAAELPSPALGVVLRHELTHVAARVVTAPGAPLWMTEGVPEYVGRKGTYTRFDDAAPDLAERVRAGGLPTGLPEDRDFAVGEESAMVAYQSAWSAAAFVANRFGEQKLKALYVGVAASDDRRRQDRSISDALGIDRAELVASWRRWLSAQVR